MSDIKIRSASYDVYKKSAAAQISLIGPKHNERGFVERSGAIFIEACEADGKGKNADGNYTYKWSTDKVSFSLGINDLALLFDNFTGKIIHQYQGSMKTLVFLPGEGTYEGTFRMILSHKDPSGVEKKVIVPFSAGEIQIFTTLLKEAVPKVLGW